MLQKQEKEFLQAYRAHMYNVQKELQQLRTRLDDAEMSLKKNDKIRKLEEARDWFREEALRLVSIRLLPYHGITSDSDGYFVSLLSETMLKI